jgi:hypothetical protein
MRLRFRVVSEQRVQGIPQDNLNTTEGAVRPAGQDQT